MAYLLHHLLSESAAKFPDSPAVICASDTITYAWLERESNKMAHTLAAYGVRRGELVGIYLNRSISALIALFGVLKAGMAYVPLDPLCPPGRLAYIVDKCGIRFLITTREKLTTIEQAFPGGCPLESILLMNSGVSERIRPSSNLENRNPQERPIRTLRAAGSFNSALPEPPKRAARLIDWQDAREAAGEEPLPVHAVDTDLAYILFTSGSTGNPKGVMLSHRNALTFINTAHSFFGIKASDRFSNVCPLHFDMSVFDLYVAVKAGACVVVIPETVIMFPLKLADVIAKNRISVWNSVPSALTLLASYKNLDKHDLSSLRLILFAGELFPLKYLRRIREAAPKARLCNMYGQTEANSSTYYWVDQLPSDITAALPIGRALPNFEVFALDEEGRQLAGPGQEGELYVRSSTVAAGYWGEPAKTEGAFVKNPLQPHLTERVYRTGDLVRMDPDGNYLFCGRKDHMIKSRGYRIEIGEIEAVLRNHPAVKNAAVIPLPDDLIGNRISAIAVPSAPGGVTKEEIVQYCSGLLPRYMVPEFIEIRDSLPATSSGKIDRKKISEELAARSYADRLIEKNSG